MFEMWILYPALFMMMEGKVFHCFFHFVDFIPNIFTSNEVLKIDLWITIKMRYKSPIKSDYYRLCEINFTCSYIYKHIYEYVLCFCWSDEIETFRTIDIIQYADPFSIIFPPKFCRLPISYYFFSFLSFLFPILLYLVCTLFSGFFGSIIVLCKYGSFI